MAVETENIIETKDRKYPLKRPSGHKVPVPRWSLRLPDGVTHIYTLYVGVQSREGNMVSVSRAEQSFQDWLDREDGRPTAVDTFRVTHGFDVVGSRVWVAYWTDHQAFETKFKDLNLMKMWNDLEDDRQSIGIWCEHFIAPLERLETNYASLKHKPGISQVPGGEFPAHDLTAYWGAGRDRIPAAKDDLFKPPEDIAGPQPTPEGIGEHLTGTNYNNMCHIRSGQWWTMCDVEEREAYEDDLQKKLMNGMSYLWEHPEETGTIGLRFLQNLDKNGTQIRETCGAGFFRNWEDLEQWSSRHPSHLAIFNGAMSHAKRFGPDRNFMTWHEVSILKSGEATFDYINCDPKTGVIRWVPLQKEPLPI